MQFKAHTAKDGSISWHLIRWEYAAVKSRSVQSSLGTVKDIEVRASEDPSKCGIWDKLTNDEKEQLRQHWLVCRKPLLMAGYQRDIRLFAARIPDARTAIAEGALSQEAGEKLYQLLDAVMGDLRRAGYNKRKTPATPVAGATGQEAMAA